MLNIFLTADSELQCVCVCERERERESERVCARVRECVRV